MPISVLMPALSPTMTEGNLVKWHKNEGDSVKSGDLLAEIETDKATMEVEAVDEGILGKILVPEGSENVPVNKLIALILEEGEEKKDLDITLQQQSNESSSGINKTILKDTKPSLPLINLSSSSNEQISSLEKKVFITPLAKRIAQKNNTNISLIQGSGPRGRIIKKDIENYINSSFASVPVVNSYKDIKLNSMRKTIAKRLSESKQTVPHFYLSIDCELEALLALRSQLNSLPHCEQKISVNDFILKASALALVQVPEVNATWHDNYIRQYSAVDISVAVAIEGGLITPIIRSAESKSLLEISKEMRSLAQKAHSGKLSPEEYQGGTFSVSNLGMFGINNFSAIINLPQVCILAVGAGEKRSIVKDNHMTIGTVMTCTLSIDHRALDGSVGAKFLSTFKGIIENPLAILL